MRIVPACGLTLIMRFEGLHDGDKRTPVLEPEADPIGIYTVGWGHALTSGGKFVRDKGAATEIAKRLWPKGMTKIDAATLLAEDAQPICNKVIAALPAIELNDHELGALVSLAYNIGNGAFAGSSVCKRLKAGNRSGAADAFLMWNKAGGVVMRGLTNRREAERTLFLTPENS